MLKNNNKVDLMCQGKYTSLLKNYIPDVQGFTERGFRGGVFRKLLEVSI